VRRDPEGASFSSLLSLLLGLRLRLPRGMPRATGWERGPPKGPPQPPTPRLRGPAWSPPAPHRSRTAASCPWPRRQRPGVPHRGGPHHPPLPAGASTAAECSPRPLPPTLPPPSSLSSPSSSESLLLDVMAGDSPRRCWGRGRACWGCAGALRPPEAQLLPGEPRRRSVQSSEGPTWGSPRPAPPLASAHPDSLPRTPMGITIRASCRPTGGTWPVGRGVRM